MKTANSDCLIAGVGGQGTVLASRLISAAALERGLDVRGCETIGMAQRGGSVLSHVRMGRGIHGIHAIRSPLISPGRADSLLAFELCEAARALRYLKPGGVMVACDRVLQPTGAAGGYDPAAVSGFLKRSVPRLLLLSAGAIIEGCGARALNVAIIGAACAAGALPFSAREMESVITARFGEAHARTNIAALRLGENLAGLAGLGGLGETNWINGLKEPDENNDNTEGTGERHGDD